MSYDDVCAFAWKGYKAGKGAGKKGPNGSGVWCCGKMMNGRVAKETMEERKEARKAPRAGHLIGTVTKTKGPVETKAKERERIQGQHSTTLPSGGLNHLVQRNAGGAQRTWKKVTVVVHGIVHENDKTKEQFTCKTDWRNSCITMGRNCSACGKAGTAMTTESGWLARAVRQGKT